MSELKSFYAEFCEQIALNAGTMGQYKELEFVQVVADMLIEAGEFNEFDLHYHSSRGVLVHGWAGDPRRSNGVLSLVVGDWKESEEVETITQSEITGAFKKLRGFLEAVQSLKWQKSWEESSEGYALAESVFSRQNDVRAIRLFLVSSRKLSSRVKEFVDDEWNGIPLQHRIWDIERLKSYLESGREREEMEIDFREEFGTSIPCLSASTADSELYKAYLAVVPGEVLAGLYDRWGTRLLEQNVRCFLQARGKVNRGIRTTIEESPDMFFAYNNGITATAEAIDVIQGEGALAIQKIKNLQIVNGGQTTASIFTAGRGKDKVDLKKVFVQMKLSVIEPAEVERVVPRISRYANTQNTVRAADFFSNHPFHVFVEKESRRTIAPSTAEYIHGSRWFYERSRGQYVDARSLAKVGAQRRKFDSEWPRKQMFTKTDLAKFWNVWRGLPHTVSQGAQKNFSEFAEYIDARWEKSENDFNAFMFREMIAKAIIFRDMERQVSQQAWYQGGYRANVVAYGIARFARAVDEAGKKIDFEKVWKNQAVSESLRTAMLEFAHKMHEVLLTPPEGIRNISEYAKRASCKDRAWAIPMDLPASIEEDCTTGSEEKQRKKEARAARKITSGIELQTEAMRLREVDADFWNRVLAFAMKIKQITPREASIIQKSLCNPVNYPSELQAKSAMGVLDRMRGEGFSE